jgi:hypothetical protein
MAIEKFYNIKRLDDVLEEEDQVEDIKNKIELDFNAIIPESKKLMTKESSEYGYSPIMAS